MGSTGRPVALVTGANKGIGKEISRQLSAKGILVLMGARHRERGEDAVADPRAEGLHVEFIHVDVTSQSSVDRAAAEVERRHGRLDILVNNAGIGLDWLPGSELSVDVLQKTFDTNVVGVFRVTKALLPLLRKSRHGRIVNMSSGLSSLTWNADPNSPLSRGHVLPAYPRLISDNHDLAHTLPPSWFILRNAGGTAGAPRWADDAHKDLLALNALN